ncbi:hypothetical protein [Helicobacter bizzozeronii]|uniref:hypothetical protein n=1 Tax=Helicobacter bizzozeronii TaxID=56877 RepID=UPI000CEE1BFC|nr:hypothetical protein [Helicobacter bizzozeronii]
MKRSLLACTLALLLASCAQNTTQDVATNTSQTKNTAQYATECSKTNIAPKKMSYKELITLIKDAKFYLLDGEFNGKKTKAYFIFSDETPSLFVLGVYRDSYKDLDLDTAKFGLEKGLLTLEGESDDGAKFKFRQDASAKISEISLVSNEFNVDKDFSSYYYSMLKIFIPRCNNNLSNEAYTKLNNAISLGAKSTDELKSKILSELKKEYASDASQQDETPHYQKDDEYVSVDLIDDRILLLHVNVNDSTNNGYNGVEDITMMGYNLKTGNPIPSGFDDVFDKTKKRQLLDFLGKRLINDPDYNDWISPAAFPLTDEPEFYITPGYVSFAWHIYDISIGTGGELTYLPIKFSDLKQFINPKSEYAYLFK